MPRKRAKVDLEARSGLLAELLDLRYRDDPVDLLATVAHVEHVLRGLGWRTLDPIEVSRQPVATHDSVRLVLSLDRCAVAVTEVIPFRSAISGHLEMALFKARLARWLIVTNGWIWRIWDAVLAEPVEVLTLEADHPERRLRLHLSRHSHVTRLLDHRALEQSRIRMVVEKLRESTIDAEAFIDDLRTNLNGAGLALSTEEIKEIVAGLFPTSEHPSTAGTKPLSGAAARFVAVDRLPRPGEATLRRQFERGVNFPGHGGGQVVWPATATHVLTRKGCSSFIRFEPSTGKTTLLPGSVMRARTQSSFPLHHQHLREQALAEGSFTQEGDFLLVVADYPMETLSTAATLVSGTVANGWASWRDREGRDIKRPPKRPSSRFTKLLD